MTCMAMSGNKGLINAVVLFVTLCATLSAYAVDEINTTFFGKLAIEGYDAVAYFTENRAVEGDKQYQYQWKGANWRFSSAQNLEKFKAEPERYAPQYGGYCAYAVAINDTAKIDPTQFTIHQGKLYLNYNAKINKKWLANRDEYIRDADKNWPELLEK